MVDESVNGFDPYLKKVSKEELESPTDKRMFVLAAALMDGWTIEELYDLTKIDPWFLYKFQNIINFQRELELESLRNTSSPVTADLIMRAKKLGFSDKYIAQCIKSSELVVRKLRTVHNIKPFVKRVDTVAAEWPASTNYLYLTYNGSDNDIETSGGGIMVLGSGVYRIGSSVEFDCCAVGCAQELRKVWFVLFHKRLILIEV
jgi:carbamoyl-phosphate synthase/aspartate carbamoyltransferase/dihydroorotase